MKGTKIVIAHPSPIKPVPTLIILVADEGSPHLGQERAAEDICVPQAEHLISFFILFQLVNYHHKFVKDYYVIKFRNYTHLPIVAR